MKGKTKKQVLAIVTAVLLAAVAILPGIVGSSVKAAPEDNNYTPIAGTSMEFTKYLVIPKDANVPNLTFSYSWVTGAAVAGGAGEMPIYAGTDPTRVTKEDDQKDLITIGTAIFTPDDTEHTENGQAGDGIANSDEKKFATKTVMVDFSNAKYKEPGVYRYIITEDLISGASTVERVRTLDVNVVDNNGSLVVSSYVMYYGSLNTAQSKTSVQDNNKKAEATGITVGDKCNNYVNKWPAQNLYIGKKIEGNQASKDKYFKFTVAIIDGGKSTSIGVTGNYVKTLIPANVNGATKDIPAAGYTNPSTITTDADDETATAVFYLQGGQYIKLMGLPEGAKYTVTEEDYSSDGYVSTSTSASNTFQITDSTTSITYTFKDPNTGTVGTDDIYTGYINKRDGLIPTGVILSVAPWIIAGIVIIGGIVFFAIRSRRKLDEE